MFEDNVVIWLQYLFMERDKMRKKIVAIIMIILGLGAMLVAGGLWLDNYMEENTAAEFSDNVLKTLIEIIELGPPLDDDFVIVPEEEPEIEIWEEDETEMATAEVDGTAYLGVLYIPRLNRSLPVTASWSYPSLRHTPGRFSGSIHDDTLVILAHNYRAHFRGISDLGSGEPVYLTDVENIVHQYQVVSVRTVDPGSTYEVTYSDYDLTLFTCTTGGQARTVVRCMRVGD